ncbi:MAG: hypothetical protein KIC56_03955 [Clostridium sp.]|jgi:hypothetical protein|nr:hypothetical protein [Clostridium sp.]
MVESNILEEIFLDREQEVLSKITEEERMIMDEIKKFNNEEKLKALIKQVEDKNLRERIDKLYEYAVEDVFKLNSVNLEKYYMQGFKDGVNLILECVK